jgi:acetyl-CoA carboxylase biotin carboxylase subunit
VRWDGGIEAGSEVGLFYDPMLAKLIVHAPDRAQAVARMHRALLELTVEGVETSRDFHLRVMEHPDFRSGDISIQWLEQHLDELTRSAPSDDARLVAALAAALVAERDRSAPRAAAVLNSSSADAAAAGAGAADAWRLAALREGLRA